jgi:UTP-glucose-1-phosphate uridylyltransferase
LETRLFPATKEQVKEMFHLFLNRSWRHVGEACNSDGF